MNDILFVLLPVVSALFVVSGALIGLRLFWRGDR